jgi:response regulator RpfG family c-di-GMP phosphodiesterase
LLNSKVGEKWFNQNGKKRGVGVDIGVGVFRLFPIPVISSQNKDTVSRIVTLVGQILIEKKTDPKKHVEDLEAQIDILAYKLYGLSEEEINIIKQSQ